jgi:hypothetical protein
MLTLRVTYSISKMAAAAAEMGGRVLRKQRGNIPLYQKRNMKEYFRNEGSTYTKWYGEGSTYTNWYANWRQFCAQVAMRLANVQTFGSQCFASKRQEKRFGCAAAKSIRVRRKKNGHLVCVAALFHKEITILQNGYADRKF